VARPADPHDRLRFFASTLASRNIGHMPSIMTALFRIRFLHRSASFAAGYLSEITAAPEQVKSCIARRPGEHINSKKRASARSEQSRHKLLSSTLLPHADVRGAIVYNAAALFDMVNSASCSRVQRYPSVDFDGPLQRSAKFDGLQPDRTPTELKRVHLRRRASTLTGGIRNREWFRRVLIKERLHRQRLDAVSVVENDRGLYTLPRSSSQNGQHRPDTDRNAQHGPDADGIAQHRPDADRIALPFCFEPTTAHSSVRVTIRTRPDKKLLSCNDLPEGSRRGDPDRTRTKTVQQ
jgi:hypothetical protein